jgi:hypothetical protein
MYLICTNCQEYFNAELNSEYKLGDCCPICCDEDDQDGGVLREWTYNIYVNVYLIDQICGGREEGGWYYLVGSPVESRCYNSMDEALEELNKLEAKYDQENKSRRPISSVLSEGEYRVMLETHFAEHWPQTKPRYE